MAGLPLMNAKSDARNIAHPSDGAPDALRQLLQWQSTSAVGAAVTR